MESVGELPPDTGDVPRSRVLRQAEPVMEQTEGAQATTTATENLGSMKIDYKTGGYVYKHRRIMSSNAFNYSVITNTNVDVANKDTVFVTTPLARIPCHATPFYMSFAEFKLLPDGAKITKCIVNIKPLGYRLPFQTNSAAISTVNAAAMVLGAYAHGLQTKLGGNNYQYESAAANPMIPTSIVLHDKEGIDITMLWGSEVSPTSKLTFDSLGASIGKEYPLQDYYTYDFITNHESVPEIIGELELFRMTPYSANTEVISWEYRPQVNCLRPPKTRLGRYQTINKMKTRFIFGEKVQAPEAITFAPDQNGAVGLTPDKLAYLGTTDFATNDVDNLYYQTQIEHGGIGSHGYREYCGGYYLPSLHVGVLPCNTFTTTVGQSDVASVTALWLVDTECHVEWSVAPVDLYRLYQPFTSMYFNNWSDVTLGTVPLNIRGYRGTFTASTETSATETPATTAASGTGTTKRRRRSQDPL